MNIYQVGGTEVPVYSEDSVNVYLINSDITVLTARIQLARTGRDISWESVEGRANIVEFTRGLPAVWETLTTVTGTFSRPTVGGDSPQQPGGSSGTLSCDWSLSFR